MRVRLRFFAMLRERLGAHVDRTVPPDATVGAVWRAFVKEHPVMSTFDAASAPWAFGYQPTLANPEREAANLEIARRYWRQVKRAYAFADAVFLEFREGRIHRQRNYDCFEPF